MNALGDGAAPTGNPSADAKPALPVWSVTLAFGAALIPAWVLVQAVRRFAVDLPYFDEWGFAGVIRKSLKGTLHFSDLYAQHNVHRLLFPRLILLGLARATGWDTRYELLVNLALGLAIAAAFGWWTLRFAEEHRAKVCLALVPLFSMMTLSLSQFENWMWGWQNQIYLVVLATASALFVLTRARIGVTHLVAAILLAAVASFSFANGLLVWPLGLTALMFPSLRESTTPKRMVAVWVLAGAAVFVAYFYKFSMPPRYNKAPEGWQAPLNFIEYFLAYIGGPFAMFKLSIGVAAGAIGLIGSGALAIYLLVARPVPAINYLAGMLLWMFALGSGLLTVFGRADFGAEQALSSRYITISNLFWIGAMMMGAAVCFGWPQNVLRSAAVVRSSRAGFVAFVIVCAGATLRADAFGMESTRQFSHLERVLRYKLLQGIHDEQMLMLAPNPKWLEYWKEVARKNGFWAWRPNAPPSMFEAPPESYKDL